MIRSKDTSRQDFIFFVDRLSTILVENALQYLPYVPKAVLTPLSVMYHGRQLDATVSKSQTNIIQNLTNLVQNICGVSILRSYVPVPLR